MSNKITFPPAQGKESHRVLVSGLSFTAPTRAPAKNFLVLFISQGFGKLAGLIFGFVAARLLGCAGFGNYAVISAFLSYFLVITDFGLSPFLVREMSQKPAQRLHIVASGLALRLALALGCFVSILLFGLLLRWPGLFLWCLLVGGLGTLLYAWNSTMTDLLTAHEKLRYAAFLDMCCQAIFLALVIGLLLRGGGILGIFISLVVSNTLRAIIMGFICRSEIKKIRWTQLDVASCKGLFQEAIWFALLGLMGVLYFKIDILLMFLLATPTAIGWYEGAYRFLEAVMVLSTSLMTALFPTLSRLGSTQSGLGQIHQTYVRASRFLILTGLVCALAITLAARPLVRLCYGDAFLPCVGLVPILMLALFLIHLNAPLGRILLALNQQKRVVKLSIITLGANILLNLLLIPRWGMYGAATTTALSEIISFIVFYPLVSSLVGPLPWKTLLRKS